MKGRPTVGLELRVGFPQEGTGIARYRDNLRTAVAAMDVGMAVLSDTTSYARLDELGPGRARLEVQPSLFKRAQRRFTLTGKLTPVRMDSPPEIFHWSHPMPLYVEGSQNVCTVHDLIPVHHPELSGVRAARLVRMLRALERVGTRFAAVSESTRSELADLIPGMGDRLSCIYASIPEEEAITSGASVSYLHEGYFIAVGRVEPRKNIRRMVTAWERAGGGRPLVLVGPDGDGQGMQELRRWLRDRNVVRFPWLPRPQMLSLLVQARAFLMPSLAEGFGMSAIEAMALGIPSMVSGLGAAQEIAGDAALQVDPFDEDDIAAGIAALASDEALRDQLIVRGRSRAAAFSQERFIERLAACYEGRECLLGPPEADRPGVRACAS